MLRKPFWVLGIDRTIQNQVGTDVYGMYFSLLSFSWLFTIFLDFGINNFNNREISRHGHMLKSYLSKIIGLKLVLGAVYFLVSSAVAYFIGYGKVETKLLMLILLNQFLQYFILYLRSNISGLQLFKQDSLISVSDRFFLILICSVLLWGNTGLGSFRIEWLVYSQSISYGISILLCLIFLFRKTGFLSVHINFKYSLVLLKKTYPFAILGLLMVMYYRIDSVMLERLLDDGKRQAGIYAQSFRLLDTLAMFPFLFSTLLLPMFSKMIAKKESVNSLSKFSFGLVIIPILGFVIPSLFFAKEIMELLYIEVDESSAYVFQILMISLLAMSGSYIFGTLLTADGQMKFLNRWALVSLLVNVLLNLILISNYKAVGCALASAITQLIMFVVQFWFSGRRFAFKFDTVLFMKVLSVVIFIFTLSWGFKAKFEFHFLSLIAIPVFAILASLVFRVFRLQSVVQLLREGRS